MSIYTWISLPAAIFVSVMWYLPEWLKRHKAWQLERKISKQRIEAGARWLAEREQMRKDRYYPGVDNDTEV